MQLLSRSCRGPTEPSSAGSKSGFFNHSPSGAKTPITDVPLVPPRGVSQGYVLGPNPRTPASMNGQRLLPCTAACECQIFTAQRTLSTNRQRQRFQPVHYAFTGWNRWTNMRAVNSSARDTVPIYLTRVRHRVIQAAIRYPRPRYVPLEVEVARVVVPIVGASLIPDCHNSGIIGETRMASDVAAIGHRNPRFPPVVVKRAVMSNRVAARRCEPRKMLVVDRAGQSSLL